MGHKKRSCASSTTAQMKEEVLCCGDGRCADFRAVLQEMAREVSISMLAMVGKCCSGNKLLSRKMVLRRKKEIYDRLNQVETYIGSMAQEEIASLIKMPTFAELQDHWGDEYKSCFKQLHEIFMAVKFAESWKIWVCCKCRSRYAVRKDYADHVFDEHLNMEDCMELEPFWRESWNCLWGSLNEAMSEEEVFLSTVSKKQPLMDDVAMKRFVYANAKTDGYVYDEWNESDETKEKTFAWFFWAYTRFKKDIKPNAWMADRDNQEEQGKQVILDLKKCIHQFHSSFLKRKGEDRHSSKFVTDEHHQYHPLMRLTMDMVRLVSSLNVSALVDYRQVILATVRAFMESRIEAAISKNALVKSEAATIAFLAEMEREEKAREKKLSKKGPRDKKPAKPQRKTELKMEPGIISAMKCCKLVDGVQLQQTDVDVSTANLNNTNKQLLQLQSTQMDKDDRVINPTDRMPSRSMPVDNEKSVDKTLQCQGAEAACNLTEAPRKLEEPEILLRAQDSKDLCKKSVVGGGKPRSLQKDELLQTRGKMACQSQWLLQEGKLLRSTGKMADQLQADGKNKLDLNQNKVHNDKKAGSDRECTSLQRGNQEPGKLKPKPATSFSLGTAKLAKVQADLNCQMKSPSNDMSIHVLQEQIDKPAVLKSHLSPYSECDRSRNSCATPAQLEGPSIQRFCDTYRGNCTVNSSFGNKQERYLVKEHACRRDLSKPAHRPYRPADVDIQMTGPQNGSHLHSSREQPNNLNYLKYSPLDPYSQRIVNMNSFGTAMQNMGLTDEVLSVKKCDDKCDKIHHSLIGQNRLYVKEEILLSKQAQRPYRPPDVFDPWRQ